MKVLINAISIKEGGSRVVLGKLLQHMTAIDDTTQWHVAANARLRGCKELQLPRIVPHFFGDTELAPMYIWCWYNRTLPKLLIETGADVLFSLTNYLPSARLSCPSLLLVQHAGHFSQLFDERMQATLSLPGRLTWRAKRRWVVRSLHQASRVTVQTRALGCAIEAQTGITVDKVTVIPHGHGLTTSVKVPCDYPGHRCWQIGYVSKFGVQKNFGVLIDAAARLSVSVADFRLHLTLNPEIEACRRVIEQAEQAGIGHLVVNHGDLDAAGVRELYEELDLFVFPSSCESFGFPMLEAMSQGMPILIADTESNREITGSGGITFDADNAKALADHITTLMQDKMAYEQAAAAMLSRAGNFSWQKAARETYELLVTTIEGVRGREA